MSFSNKKIINFVTKEEFSLVTRKKLSESKTFYVRKDGNNSNTGLTNDAAGAFLTIQHAINSAQNYDFGNNPSLLFQILVGPGTYEEALKLGPLTGLAGNFLQSVQVKIIGDENNPENVIVYPPSNNYYGIDCNGKTSQWYLSGFRLNAARLSNYGAAIIVSNGGDFNFGSIYLTLWSGIYGLMVTNRGSSFNANNWVNLKVSGGCRTFAYASSGAKINFQAPSLTMENFSCTYQVLRAMNFSEIVFYVPSLIGSATGKKFTVDSISVIDTFGSGINGVPGTIAGTSDSLTSGYYY